MLTVEQILAARSKKELAPLMVEAWGGKVNVRIITVAELFELYEALNDMNELQQLTHLLELLVCDDEGQPLLVGQAADVAGAYPAGKAADLVDDLMVACGAKKDEDAAGKSEPIPSSDSGSS